LGIHQYSNSQSGNPLGSVWAHSFTFSYSWECECDSWVAFLDLHIFHVLDLLASPRLRLQQLTWWNPNFFGLPFEKNKLIQNIENCLKCSKVFNDNFQYFKSLGYRGKLVSKVYNFKCVDYNNFMGVSTLIYSNHTKCNQCLVFHVLKW
jgi:hypothetical protein